MVNVLVSITALTAMSLLIFSRFSRSQAWHATVTPLASIIGSGFLVSVPLLASEVGDYAIVTMAVLAGLAYLIGATIRFNIRHTEALLSQPEPPVAIASVDRLSHIALAFAYFISVAYYLQLLSTFLLKAAGHPDALAAKWITTSVLIAIGSTGLWRGLGAIERMEKYAVSANLAAIVALLIGLAWYNLNFALQGRWALAHDTPPVTMDTLRLVLGMLIVVQGFETSRFMGAEFPAELRITTMRRAQIISTVIYLTFFSLVTVMFPLNLHQTGVAAILDIVGHVAVALPLILSVGAIASQFSASVADSIGAAGLIREVSDNRVSTRHAYPLIATIAVVVTWETNVFGIIALASRAFALFYLIQCIVALMTLRHCRELPSRTAQTALFASLAVLCGAVVLFAIPSGG